MKMKVLFLLILVIFSGISYANHYNLMVAGSVLKKHGVTADKISNTDFQIHQYTDDGTSGPTNYINPAALSQILLALGTLNLVAGTLFMGYGILKSSQEAIKWSSFIQGSFHIGTGIFALSGILRLLENRSSNKNLLLLKNYYPYPLHYDVQHSHCQNGSGQAIQGNDIYPAPTPPDADANTIPGNAAALSANASSTMPANTAPVAIAGKVKVNGKLSPALKRDIEKNAYSIGAIMMAGKKGINCTLAYSADKGISSTAYANEVKVLVTQSPSRLDRAGQLQVHVLPQGDLRGAPVLIQQPQAEPQTPQMLQQFTHPLKSAVAPFAKQKQNGNTSHQDKSKPGVAIISLSPTAN